MKENNRKTTKTVFVLESVPTDPVQVKGKTTTWSPCFNRFILQSNIRKK